MSGSYDLRTFGSPALLSETGEQLLTKGKLLALLAYCAADRRRTISRDECAALLWSDLPADRARHSVRQVIWRLRKLLGDVFATRDDLIVGVGPALITDREQFLEAVHADQAGRALDLYRGPFLDGLVLPGGDGYEEWLHFERHRLTEALVQVVDRAAERAFESDRPGEARELADRLVERVPTHLTARRLMVDCALAAGDMARARQEAEALEADAQLEGVILPPRVALTLAKLRQPTQHTAEATPVIALDFVGRDGHFSEILSGWQAAQRGQARAYFVTGAAGIGKSRLLQVVYRRCAGKSTRAVLVRANVGEQAIAFGFISLLVRALGAQPGAMGVSETSARELVALDPSLASSFKVAAASWDPSEGPRRRALALVDLIQAVAEQQPLALLIDDWHWMDAASRELLTVALGRCDNSPVLVIVGSRQAQELPALPFAQRLSLAPLTLDDSLDALRSTGTWPSGFAAHQFLTLLATASRGVPLDLYERLTMAIDTGQLQWHDGEWHANAWETLAKEVAAASPLARRLAACGDAERRALLLLSVAGTPLLLTVLSAAVRELSHDSHQKHSEADVPNAVEQATPSDEALTTTLSLLEGKGLLRSDAQVAMLSHDTIAEAVADSTSREARRNAHRALAASLEAQLRSVGGAVSTGGVETATAALRHALHAGDTVSASRLLTRTIHAARLRGDTRSARTLLQDLMGVLPAEVNAQHVLRGVPLWQRWGRPSGWSVGVGTVMFAVVLLVAAWRMAAAPSVRVMQAPASVLASLTYGPDAYRLVPALIISTGGTGADSVNVQVTSLTGSADVLAGATQRAPHGVISLSSLRVRMKERDAILEVKVEGHRPVQVSVRRDFAGGPDVPESSIAAAFVEGTFGKQRITPRSPSLRVRPREYAGGVVQVRYSSMIPAASVWVSYTPSWGDPEVQGREVSPLQTPTQSDVADVPVQFVAPDKPGTYWLIVVVASEPSGGYVLSGTNWTTGRPIWKDGNEVALLPDSVITEGNRNGFVMLWSTFPAGWARGDTCRTEKSAATGTKLCKNPIGLFGIPVVVE